AEIISRLVAAMVDFSRPLQMTLTVKSRDEDLGDQLRSVRQAFRRLRQRPEWKSRVARGWYTFEITLNPTTRLWHPHVHVLFDGKYFPQQMLSRLWHECTDDSKIVWVADVKSLHNAAHELAQYLGKPAHVEGLTPMEIRTYTDATKGTRMIQSFGGVAKPTAPKADREPLPVGRCFDYRLDRVVHLAQRGCAMALELAAAIADRWILYAPYIYDRVPELMPEDLRTRLEELRARGLTKVRVGPLLKIPDADQVTVMDREICRLFTEL
ncbi:unnamed protein product, partial [marine sediment metagenome]